MIYVITTLDGADSLFGNDLQLQALCAMTPPFVSLQLASLFAFQGFCGLH